MIIDHLTVQDTTPAQLARVAARSGFDAIGTFLHSLPEIGDMPDFDLVRSATLRAELREILAGEGVSVAIAYPFNLTRTSAPDDFLPALDAAAEIGATAINLLVFDRDLERRAAAVAGLCEHAAARGLAVGIEFYPASSLRTLAEAVALCDAAAAPNLGLTVDLLHLHRSGARPTDLVPHRRRILFAQLCDAPAKAPEDLFREAAEDRLLPGEGELDPAAFLDACGPGARIGVEAPCLRLRHLPPETRARAVREAAGAILEMRQSN